MDFEKAIEEIPIEELGFEIHPTCKICNSPYKLEIDKMILQGVMLSRIVDFCIVVNPKNNKQRITGTAEVIRKNIYKHKKHITIDKSKIEEAQQKSMILYKAKVKEGVSLETAKQLATQRMVDDLNDDDKEFTMNDLAIPIGLEQRERSVKVEEGALQINFAKFIKSNNPNEQISGDEVKGLENSIRELNKRISKIGEEIRSIEEPAREN